MDSILNLSKKLIDWIIGMTEDCPIPYEIRHLYFLIVQDIKGYHLEFGGREKKDEVIEYLDYYPLEAQFFIYDYPKSIKEFSLMIEEAFDIAFNNKDFSMIFENKIVYVSIFRKRISKRL